jgi:subtilisin family serine protease
MSAVPRSQILALVIVCLLLPALVSAAPVTIREGYVIVKLKPEAAQTARLAKSAMASGLSSLDRLNVRYDIRDFQPTIPAYAGLVAAAVPKRDLHGLSRYFTVELAPGTDVLKAVSDYAADPNVEIAEPDYIAPLELVPNDPDYSQQWTHFNALNKDIDTQQSWDLEVGDSTVIVGVIDSGLDHDHPDLMANVWVNPGEDLDGDGVPWDADDMNGLDDDGNALVDDLIGYDWMPVQGGCNPSEDCNGPDNNPMDFNGHGTHVNGIIGAVTGNAVAVAGIAGGQRDARRPGVKLMGLRAGYEANDGNGFVIMSACAAAADYAVAKGAFGLNCSWGSSGTLIRTALLNAVSNGLVVCKAAGNDTSDVADIADTTFGVLAVASLDANGSKSSFSNYGTWVDISAPGNNIYNTYCNNGVSTYAALGGTSMASPTVLGVAALLKSHHPWFDKTELDTLLLNYTSDIYLDNPGWVGLLGTGRVNANNALSILTTADYDIDTGFGEAPLTVNFTDVSPNAPNGPYLYEFGDGNTATTANAQNTYVNPGVYSVKFTASGPTGPHTRIRPEQIVAIADTIEYGDTANLVMGQKVGIPIRLRNSHRMTEIFLPFVNSGTPGITVDSLVKTGLTGDWSGFPTPVYNAPGAKVWRIRTLGTGTPIPAGNNIIAHLWITVTSAINGAETLDTATLGASQYTLRLISNYANFKPRFIGGTIFVGAPCDCPCQGDPACDGVASVVDVVNVVNVAFRGQADTVDGLCPHVGRTDLDCSCATDVLDVVLIVNRAFRGDSAPQCNMCDTPCF